MDTLKKENESTIPKFPRKVYSIEAELAANQDKCRSALGNLWLLALFMPSTSFWILALGLFP